MCVCLCKILRIKLLTFSSIGKTIIVQFINQTEVNIEDIFPIISKNQ